MALCFNNKDTIKALLFGVMAALEFLALTVQVRILGEQQIFN